MGIDAGPSMLYPSRDTTYKHLHGVWISALLRALQKMDWKRHMKVTELFKEASSSLEGNDRAMLNTRLGFNVVETVDAAESLSASRKAAGRKGRATTETGRKKQRFMAGCSDKTRFKSLDHAKEAKERIRYISAMESNDGKPSDYLPIRAYFCSNCIGFHLTSRPDRDDATISVAS